jgi:hypothetical protein
MMDIIADMPSNVAAVSVQGQVTGDDYDKVLTPLVVEKLKDHDKVRLLFHMGPEFTGFTGVALWDDAKLGISHYTSFEKVAVVSDVHWVANSVKFLGVFVPCPVKLYANEAMDEAKTWVSEVA